MIDDDILSFGKIRAMAKGYDTGVYETATASGLGTYIGEIGWGSWTRGNSI